MERPLEKESSRRSWPWKRKSNDKISASPDLGPSPVPTKSYDNHQVWQLTRPQYDPERTQCSRLQQYVCALHIVTHAFNLTGLIIIQIWEYQQPDVPSHQRQPSPMKGSGRVQDRNRVTMDEARGQWLQSEERAIILSEKLSHALVEITSKDNLVKQHVKVAEEAVSGKFFPR